MFLILKEISVLVSELLDGKILVNFIVFELMTEILLNEFIP